MPEIKDRRRRLSHDAIRENNKNTITCPENAQQVSMDSLARQSLLAAQVLHLIPTEKARERNFLQGRIGANSMLGPVELDKVLPNREIKIFIGKTLTVVVVLGYDLWLQLNLLFIQERGT